VTQDGEIDYSFGQSGSHSFGDIYINSLLALPEDEVVFTGSEKFNMVIFKAKVNMPIVTYTSVASIAVSNEPWVICNNKIIFRKDGLFSAYSIEGKEVISKWVSPVNSEISLEVGNFIIKFIDQEKKQSIKKIGVR
jgi:hypothetical protein